MCKREMFPLHCGMLGLLNVSPGGPWHPTVITKTKWMRHRCQTKWKLRNTDWHTGADPGIDENVGFPAEHGLAHRSRHGT